MMIERRGFLLGLASVVASPAIAAGQKFIGATEPGILHPGLPRRAICSMLFASMPTGEQIRSSAFREHPVHYRFIRGNDTILSIQMNPRASHRWVAVLGEDIVVPKGELFMMDVEPCFSITTLTMSSNIESIASERPKMFTEVFEWTDGKLMRSHISACDPQDAHILERA